MHVPNFQVVLFFRPRADDRRQDVQGMRVVATELRALFGMKDWWDGKLGSILGSVFATAYILRTPIDRFREVLRFFCLPWWSEPAGLAL